MDQQFAGLGVLFVAGFGPITRESDESKAFYVEALGLPLKPMPGNETYLLSEQGALDGVKHFALWPLAQAAQSCFGGDRWPADLAVPKHGSSLTWPTWRPPPRGWSIAVIGCWSPIAKSRGGRALHVCLARKACWSASLIRPGCGKRHAVRRRLPAVGGLRTNTH